MTKDFTLLDLTEKDLKNLLEKYDKEKIKFTAEHSISDLESNIKKLESDTLECIKIIKEKEYKIIEYTDRIKLNKQKIHGYKYILKEYFGE